MKLSDYVVSFLAQQGVRDVFLLAGGGIMHLLDSLAKNEQINKYYNLHEQASGFAADAYAQYTNKLGVVFATTGPGATNVVTSLASAYIDSTPMLVISGQVKTADITTMPEVRQTGAQEVGIVPIVQSVTKYAITVMQAEDIRYVLEKAVWLALHGRPGTVWVDIPLDIQAKDIQPDGLHGFRPPVEHYQLVKDVDIDEVLSCLMAAKRPCVLAGSGVMLAGGRDELVRLTNDLKVPTVTSRRVKRFFHMNDERYYYGSVGMVGPRYANYVLQNADFLLVIGSGLRYYVTAYNEAGFAPKAKKIMVNIQSAEIDKLRMSVDKAIVCDAKKFLVKLRLAAEKLPVKSDWQEWRNYCDKMRENYPAIKECIAHDDGLTDGYMVAECINRYAREDDVYVASPSAFAYTYNIYDLRGQQEYICPVGLGSMGTGLPAAIGACIASGKRRTIIGEGDGSLQHNIQELALIKKYDLPIKLFVDNNHGYRQIYTMQQTHFNGRLAGCTKASGISMPDLKKIAEAYGLEYLCIDTVDATEAIVRQALSDNRPTLIEMLSSSKAEFVPITKSKIGRDGKIISSCLENLYPFLPEKEHLRNMSISQS